MDNKRSPQEKRIRHDVMTTAERKSLSRGYPVRTDADRQNYRNVNYRPRAGSENIPEYMRRGEVPVRKNNSPQNNMVDPSSAHTATMEISRESLSKYNGTDSLETTRTISRSAICAAAHKTTDDMDKTVCFDRNALYHTEKGTPENTTSSKMADDENQHQSIPEKTKSPKSLMRRRRRIYITLIGVILGMILIAVMLSVALRDETILIDYDMAQGFSGNALTIPDSPENFSTQDTVSTEDSDSHLSANDISNTETETEITQQNNAETKFTVTLTFYDRDPITVSTGRVTLGALLDTIGYVVKDTDNFPLDLTTELTEDVTIAVDTLTYTTVSETVTIPYSSKVTEVQTIPRGTKEFVQYGQNGEKIISYTITLLNGEEISREQTGESITKYPVDEICTLGVGGTLTGADGVTYSYSHYKIVSATYYDLEGITYLGYNADESVVATDLNYIPMGTKLYVKSDIFDFGVRTAADTGSLINGWEVDIWLSDSNPQKAAFAQGGYWTDMRVYFLD